MAEEDQLVESKAKTCSNIADKMLGIRWTLENVSKIQGNMTAIGPEFYLKPEYAYRAFFRRNKNRLYVFLCNKSDAKITFQRTLALFDYNNKKLHEENDAMIFSLEKDRDIDIIGAVNINLFDNLPNDTLIINVGVNIIEVATKNLKLLLRDQDPKRKLSEDLKTMLETPVNSDVSLIVGEEQIAAHWSILCSRSPYFKKMFESGMEKERVQNYVGITDMSFCTLKKLTQFLYTADFIQADDIQELFDLYYAADKWEMMDFRDLCGRCIISEVSTDNVTEILKLSYRHNDNVLKSGAIRFIRSHSDAVFQEESWKKFKISDPDKAELLSMCLEKN